MRPPTNSTIVTFFTALLCAVIAFFAVHPDPHQKPPKKHRRSVLQSSRQESRLRNWREPDCRCPSEKTDLWTMHPLPDPMTVRHGHIRITKFARGAAPFDEMLEPGRRTTPRPRPVRNEPIPLGTQVDENGKEYSINPMFAVRKSVLGKKIAVLFRDAKYDNGLGYWIALSTDAGETWRKYYTGLAEDYFLRAKLNSSLSLWQNDSTLQWEAGRIQIDRSSLVQPRFGPIRWTLLEDSLLVLIDVADLTKDSDGDGMTDIAEERLWMNPHAADTDGDGMFDNADVNPRHSPSEQDATLLYEAILSERGDSVRLSDFIRKKKGGGDIRRRSARQRLTMMVTKDAAVSAVHNRGDLLLILTPEEYEAYRARFITTPPRRHLGSMCRCSGEIEQYKIFTGGPGGSRTYYVSHIGRDWLIELGRIMVF